MKYKGDIGLYLSGAPVPIPECALYIVQPTIKQIVQFGETNFLTGVHLFARTENFVEEIRAGNTELSNKSDFQLLMLMINQDKNIQRYINDFFELTFPDYAIKFKKNAIEFYINQEEQENVAGMVTIYSFEAFSRTVRELFIPSTDKQEDFNPANEAAKKIAEKLKKGRSKVQEKSGQEDKVSLYGTYTSILAIGLQMDINVFFSYTPFQIHDAFFRYWKKDKFDWYRKIASTPMMDVSQMETPDEWTEDLYLIAK